MTGLKWDSILPAVVSGAFSLMVAVYSLIRSMTNQRSLELLRANLAQAKAEKDARIDYEYEARKRLYHECEPLLFQLTEVTASALARDRLSFAS